MKLLRLRLPILLAFACRQSFSQTLPGFTLTGENWTYDPGDGGAVITGILSKPSTNSRLPAVLISHGKGGTASRLFAAEGARDDELGPGLHRAELHACRERLDARRRRVFPGEQPPGAGVFHDPAQPGLRGHQPPRRLRQQHGGVSDGWALRRDRQPAARGGHYRRGHFRHQRTPASRRRRSRRFRASWRPSSCCTAPPTRPCRRPNRRPCSPFSPATASRTAVSSSTASATTCTATAPNEVYTLIRDWFTQWGVLASHEFTSCHQRRRHPPARALRARQQRRPDHQRRLHARCEPAHQRARRRLRAARRVGDAGTGGGRV